MKYLLALAVLTSALVSLSNASCYVKPRDDKEITHCVDDTDGTLHAVGSSWRNSECMNCNCDSCCTAYSIPRDFPDDCVSVFDKVNCEYIVHKKDDPKAWLWDEEYDSLNEATPSSHINYHVPRSAGRGGAVAAIYHSSLQVNPKPKATCNSFESPTLSLCHHNWKSEKPVVVAWATCGCLCTVPI